MGPFDLLRHPLIFTGISVPQFLRWYFWEKPRNILHSYSAYLRAFIEIFSFLFLFRTLVAPWKQIQDAYPSNGLNLGKISEAFALNMVSRTIGFLFRSFTLVIGIGFVVALTLAYAAFFVLWLLFPVLFWTGFSYVASVALKLF